ncbi:MAG TPA: hypothetical protein PLS84_11110 [Salinivirgaceae bacterium]|nr:hypothetical protein [Salinivirgaceae bacterium]
MKLIQDNPYRIAGILSNANARELERQKAKITRYASIGKQVDSELDFPFLGNVDRSESSITKAFSGIEQNQDKVSHSLFWFLKANTFDETAINYLINGDKEKAVEIWDKVTNGKEVTSKNFSCFNNIGTLKLLSNSKDEIKEGIEAKIKLIESPNFTDFVHTVADQTYTIDNQKQIEKFVDDVLKQFKGKYSSSDTLKLFSSCNGTTQKYLSQKFTEEPLHKIESQIETCKKKRKENKGNAYEFGLKLYTNTKDELALLKSILGTSDLKYKALADQLANEIMQCGIDYFNESQENNSRNNYLESSQKLTKLADSIAVGKMAKDRAKDSLATLEDMKDREINKAIAILSSIKLAYEKAISEIDAQVARMRMTMSYNQTINYSKVDKMKADCLNWNKVVEVVSDGISMNDVETIQRCSNQAKVSEYKSLVDFLIGKLGPIQINQIKHICYWKDLRAAQAKSTAKQVGKTISTATDGCYIATMAYGDYNHPQVLELRTFRDDFLSKSYLGRNFIKLYYKYSPLLVEKLKDKAKTNDLIRTLLDQFIKIIKK